MRISVEVDEKTVREVQRLTGIAKKSPALSMALREYLREMAKRRLIQRVMEGKTDYGSTNEELEARSRYETH